MTSGGNFASSGQHGLRQIDGWDLREVAHTSNSRQIQAMAAGEGHLADLTPADEELLLDAQDCLFEGNIEAAELGLQRLLESGTKHVDIFVMLWECQTQLLKDSAALDTALDFGVEHGSSARQLGMLLISATSCSNLPVLNGIVESMCKVEVDDAVFALARAAIADAKCSVWQEPLDPAKSSAAASALTSSAAATTPVDMGAVLDLPAEEVYNAWRVLCKDAPSDLVAACSAFAASSLLASTSELAIAMSGLLLYRLLPLADASDAWEGIVHARLGAAHHGGPIAAVAAVLAADTAECKRVASLGGHFVSPMIRRALLRESVGSRAAVGHAATSGIVETTLA